MKNRGIVWLGATALLVAGGCQPPQPKSPPPPSSAPLLQSSAAAHPDESQPEYWTKQLAQKESRPRAVQRLQQFFEDALAAVRDPGPGRSRLDDPKVTGLVDGIIHPLVKTYVEGYAELDPVSRVACIQLIASFRDPRAEPALKKALEDFVARPKTKTEDQDIRWAIRAQRDLKLPYLSPLILQVFQKLEVHTPLGGITYKDLNDAMLAAPDRAWVEPLEAMLRAEIELPNSKDRSSFDRYRDQLFWQVVACQILGEIGDPSAVTPLMKVVLDPQKGDMAVTAVLALVKLGKPSVDAAAKLLKGESRDLVEFHVSRLTKVADLKTPLKDDPAMQLAAVMLGAIGRPEGLPPMLALLKSTSKPALKAVLLREIAKISATPASKAAFRAAFEQLPVNTEMRFGKALPQLVEESVVRFHDATMIDWLLQRARQTQGLDPETRKDFQSTILFAALKLAKPNQLRQAADALKQYGTPDRSKQSPNVWWSGYYEGPLYARAEELLNACGSNPACYLSNLQKAEAQAKEADRQFIGIKAAYMLAAFGDEGTATEIVQAMPNLENPAVRFSAAQTIDYLLPRGSEEVARQLDATVRRNAESGDKDKMAADQPLREVMARLRTRALAAHGR